MDYDPIKNRIGEAVAGKPWLTKLFYTALQLLFLRNWYIRRELKHIISQKAGDNPFRILDAGTGFGQFSYFMAKNFGGVEIRAIDIKPEYLDRARQFVESQELGDIIRFEVDDLTQLSAAGPYDLIVCVDVMEHIEDDLAVFDNFKRVLAPGGTVLINTPSDQGGSDASEDDHTGFIGEHVRVGYGKEEISSKLRANGLRPMQLIYTYGRAGDMGWRILIKAPMKMLAVSRWFFILLPIYYLLALPLGMILNWMDTHSINESGTGLLVIAENPRQ